MLYVKRPMKSSRNKSYNFLTQSCTCQYQNFPTNTVPINCTSREISFRVLETLVKGSLMHMLLLFHPRAILWRILRISR